MSLSDDYDVQRGCNSIYGYRETRTWERSGGSRKCSKINGFSDYQNPDFSPTSPRLLPTCRKWGELGEKVGKIKAKGVPNEEN